MEELIKYANKLSKEYPNLKDAIDDIIQLCKDEIEEGGSTQGEIEHAFLAIDELL